MTDLKFEEVYSYDRTPKIIKQDIYNNFNYYIISYGTHPCAYVEIPREHRYFQEHYDDIDILCHGGVTYSENHLLDMSNSWFLGWDYAHFGDYYYHQNYIENGKKWSLPEIVEETEMVIDQL